MGDIFFILSLRLLRCFFFFCHYQRVCLSLGFIVVSPMPRLITVETQVNFYPIVLLSLSETLLFYKGFRGWFPPCLLILIGDIQVYRVPVGIAFIAYISLLSGRDFLIILLFYLSFVDSVIDLNRLNNHRD